jgi:hypothetical protein
MGRILDTPKRTKFNYPGAGTREGTVIRATQVRVHNYSTADYATRVELTQPDDKESKLIPFAYYRRPTGGGDDDWTFASPVHLGILG